mgnify:CR=1 FL=1
MDAKLLTGTVEMLILQVLMPEPTYGYQITQEVLERSQGYFQLKEGSLYPALHRMENQGLLSSYWVETESGRRRKYYRITATGKKALAEKKAEWRQFTFGIDSILGTQSNALA